MLSYAIEPHFVDCTKECVQYFYFLLLVATKVGRDGDGIVRLRKGGVASTFGKFQEAFGSTDQSLTLVLGYIIGSILLVHVT